MSEILKMREEFKQKMGARIEPGDIVGIDSGLEYLGYETDIKRTAYVLERSETEPPQNIQKAGGRSFC